MSHTIAPTNDQRIIAPYITSWSIEQDQPYRLVQNPGGIGYAEEVPTHRDTHGVLWCQTASNPGHGRPQFGQVHPARQRRAMARLLLQVCGGPADQTGDGVLWIQRDHQDDWPSWPECMASVEPPVCQPCAPVSLRGCPALRRGAVVMRVREFPIIGVRGALYRPGALAPVLADVTNVPYDDPAVRWIRASALIRQLRGCTIIPAGELAKGLT